MRQQNNKHALLRLSSYFYISPIHEIFAFKKHNNHEITIVCIIKVSSESLYIQNMFYPLRSRDDHPFVGGSTGPVGWRSL